MFPATIYFVADGKPAADPVPTLPTSATGGSPDTETVFRVTVTEHERGWGQRSETEDYATAEAAQARIVQINSANTAWTAPDHYFQASPNIQAVVVPRLNVDEDTGEVAGEQTFGPEMFTAEGDQAVRDAVDRMQGLIRMGTMTPSGVKATLYELTKKVADEHSEVFDTEPRGWILDQVNVTLRENGYAELDQFPF